MTGLFVNAVIVFASRDNSLIEINSVVATVIEAFLWISCLTGFKMERKAVARSAA